MNREVQTVNWEVGKKGAVETGVKSGLKKAHKTVNHRGRSDTQAVRGYGILVDVSDIETKDVSALGEGKGESEAPGGGGGRFLLKIPGGGGFSGRVGAGGRRAGRVVAGNVGGGG